MEKTTRWSLAEAAAEFPALSALAEECGYRASLFGSVMTNGEGRDLDVLLSPFGRLQQEQVRFLARFGGVIKGTRRDARKGTNAFQVEKNDRLYDFVFGGFWAPRR